MGGGGGEGTVLAKKERAASQILLLWRGMLVKDIRNAFTPLIISETLVSVAFSLFTSRKMLTETEVSVKISKIILRIDEITKLNCCY